MALVVAAVVWPLEKPSESPALEPLRVMRITPGRLTVADRERALASLTAKNPFSADGRFWAAPPGDIADGDGAPDGDAPGGSGPGGAPANPANLPVPAVLANAAEMPADIRPAFENLRLIGVRSGADAEPIAIIALVSNLQVVREHAVGSEFVDDKFAQTSWRIVGIDIARDRVVLERSGKRVSLALYPAEPIPVAAAPEAAAPEASAATAPQVVGATPDEVARELREAGITDAEIAELMRLMEQDPAAFAAARAAADTRAGKKDEPEGLGAVLELMRSATEKKKDDAPPPTDPPDA
jgi:hypothetical protein